MSNENFNCEIATQSEADGTKENPYYLVEAFWHDFIKGGVAKQIVQDLFPSREENVQAVSQLAMAHIGGRYSADDDVY